MTPVDAAVVRRKLGRIALNLGDLERVEGLPLEAYVQDRFRLKGTERLLQETVEAAVDINFHILRALGLPPTPDYFRSFVEMGRQGVLPPELADRLAPSAGLRNRLVHEYEAIDDHVVLESVGEALRDFADYVAAVETWLARQGL